VNIKAGEATSSGRVAGGRTMPGAAVTVALLLLTVAHQRHFDFEVIVDASAKIEFFSGLRGAWFTMPMPS